MEYILHLSIMVVFYTILSQSLNFVAGYSGLLSLTQAGFYGIGAYTTAILSTQIGFPFWLNLPIAIVITGIVAYLISFIAVRTIGDYFIVCTLGIQVIIYALMNNWMLVTKGPRGIRGIPEIRLISSQSMDKAFFLFLSIVLMSIVWWVLQNMSRNGYGYTLTALKEDEIYTQSIGKNVDAAKITAFTISGAIAAVPGVLYAHYMTFIDPSSFTVNESIFILSIVIVGGLGNLIGSFFAAIILVLLPEFLRFVGLANDVAANIRQIIYGLLLIVLMMTGRNGIIELMNIRSQKNKNSRNIINETG